MPFFENNSNSIHTTAQLISQSFYLNDIGFNIQFHCCGVRDYTDWYRIKAWPQEDWVPDSCCIKRERYCGRLDTEGKTKESWYKEGCASAIQMWLVTRLHIVGTVGLVVGFLQLFGLVASMILFCTVRHKRLSHTYKSYDTAT